MADAPLVSIVVPCFNGEAYLADALDSARAQTWPNTEIIVVDDGSTDRSVELARSVDGVQVSTGPNGGPSAARNRGIRAARGARLQFLDADDVLLPRKIERCLQAIERPGDVPVSLQRTFGHQVRQPGRLARWFGEPARPFDPAHPLVVGLTTDLQTNQPLHDTAQLKRLGGFDEQLGWLEDIEILVRIVLDGARFVRVPEVLSLLREHDSPTRQRLAPGTALGRLQGERVMMAEVRAAGAWTDELARVFADRLAYSARQAWLAGLCDEAIDGFIEAEHLSSSPRPTSMVPYNTLTRWVGLQRTERWATRARDLIGRGRSLTPRRRT